MNRLGIQFLRLSLGLFLLTLGLSLLIPAALCWGVELPDREFWEVGISAFKGKYLSSENQYLTHSLPLLIKERLEAIERHYFSPQEGQEYRRALVQKKRQRLGRQLAAFRQERDELFFTKLRRSARDQKAAEYDRRIQETIEQLATLKSLVVEEISFPEDKPVRFKAGEQTGLLLESPQFSPLRLARQEEVDLIIWGYLEEVQDYLYLEIKALDAVLEREVYAYSDGLAREELGRNFDEVVEGLARVILGREWASLRVIPDPRASALYLDDRYIGRGESFLEYLLPGERSLRVSFPGFREQLLSLSLEAGRSYERRIVLESLDVESVLLTSEPPGAMVYQDSVWLGDTPLKLRRPREKKRILLRRPGYTDYAFYLDEETEPAVPVTLEPDILAPEELQEKLRDRFYTSFGLWALTLPLPIISFGLAADYAAASNRAIADKYSSEAKRLFTTANRLYYAHLGTLGLNVSLFVNMFINLIKYINSADRKAN